MDSLDPLIPRRDDRAREGTMTVDAPNRLGP
jgi:hypothetical protein